MRARSLGFRLIVGASLWIAAALAAAGVVLAEMFRSHVETNFEARMDAELNRLAAAVAIGADGRPSLTRGLADPLFDQPYSGRYWQIEGKAGVALRSRSLWDSALDLPPVEQSDGARHRHRLAGPNKQALLALERTVDLPDGGELLRLAVAADQAELAPAIAAFNRTLVLSLGLLGVGLGAAVLAQVRYGLRPLKRLGAALAELRGGRRSRIGDAWPDEVAPLVADFDAVLEHERAGLSRARAQAGNLAHALKTPLAVMANEAGERTGALADMVRREAAAMQRQIDHHLARARAAGVAALPGARTDAEAVAQDLARTLAKLYAQRRLDIGIGSAPGACFRGDREDLAEMLGNLLDNACKWARGRVAVRLAADAGRLIVTIEDDGPGLDAAARKRALERGARLDESAPGSGLGLAIARELAELYGGSLGLGDAGLGGLRVTLDLPAA